MSTTRERWEAELVSVPRGLVEAAIDALREQAVEAKHWRGRRDERIDVPLKAARELLAIIGKPPEPTPDEVAANKAASEKWIADYMAEHRSE